MTIVNLNDLRTIKTTLYIKIQINKNIKLFNVFKQTYVFKITKKKIKSKVGHKLCFKYIYINTFSLCCMETGNEEMGNGETRLLKKKTRKRNVRKRINMKNIGENCKYFF